MTDQYAPAPQYAEPARGTAYASWGIRLGAYLIDNLITLPVVLVANFLLARDSGGMRAVAIVLYLATAVFAIWNVIFRQGRTGQTIGKQQLKIRLVSELDGQPIGPLKSFLRQLAHILDSIFYIGYLWPLWDAKRQTFADKIMTTVVLADGRRVG